MLMRLRISLTIFFLLLAGRTTYASTFCARLKLQPDAWVAARVNALVLAAHTLFNNDNASDAYKRTVNGIATTLRQCKLTEDQSFISHYREFTEYIEALSLDQQPDHELGFMVPDKQYFEETRQYVQIPEFLLTQTFLRSVSRDETLNRAKLLLQELNSKRDPAEQLIFFSYRSQHLGTPDNDDSYERLLIVVPGNAEKGVPEKWVQFGITDRRARIHIRNLSVVSATPGPDGSSKFYFKDYYRTYCRDG